MTESGNSEEKNGGEMSDKKEDDKEKDESKEDKEKDESKEDKEKDVSPCKKDAVADDDDHDDYLLYLEDILKRVHGEFYEHLDKGERKALREIIPTVKRRVLKGLQLTFSGLIPTQQKLEDSRAYRVAKAFGAEVEQVIIIFED